MNPWQALINKTVPEQRKDWPEPVKTNGRNLNVAPPRPAAPLPPLLNLEFTPPMDAPCTCGLRYGMHRVKDYRCPNQEWRPGNGKAQWLTAVFRRAA